MNSDRRFSRAERFWIVTAVLSGAISGLAQALAERLLF